jgi:hypothetical protein
MKLIALTLKTIASLETAMACSMPLPSVRQMGDLNRALESAEFQTALNEQMRNDYMVHISSIDFQNGVTAHLSNGCDIIVRSRYEAPTHHGLCPRFKGVTVESSCN